jgi:YHS domain-containing protein
MAIDPVCKMQVEEKTAAGKSEYRGKAYFFCSDQCKQTFDRSPERYAKEESGGAGR